MAPVQPLLIVGLGNPSPTYTHTRHNIGRMVVEALLDEHRGIRARLTRNAAIPVSVPHFKGHAFRLRVQGETLVIVPDLGTFMNESGPALERVRAFYNLPTERTLVVHDDIDLPLGRVRISHNASDGGHNGVGSIITALGTASFVRLRIGIETRSDKKQPPAEAFVLQPFPVAEAKDALMSGSLALETILLDSILAAMNAYNASNAKNNASVR